MFGLRMTTLIISNEEMNDIMKMVKFLENAGLLIKGVSKTIENEFFGLLLGTLGASLLGNIVTGKGVMRAG